MKDLAVANTSLAIENQIIAPHISNQTSGNTLLDLRRLPKGPLRILATNIISIINAATAKTSDAVDRLMGNNLPQNIAIENNQESNQVTETVLASNTISAPGTLNRNISLTGVVGVTRANNLTNAQSDDPEISRKSILMIGVVMPISGLIATVCIACACIERSERRLEAKRQVEAERRKFAPVLVDIKNNYEDYHKRNYLNKVKDINEATQVGDVLSALIATYACPPHITPEKAEDYFASFINSKSKAVTRDKATGLGIKSSTIIAQYAGNGTISDKCNYR